MALLAESVVEEWLNRKGFFTIRGVKHGPREMDLLAVKHKSGGVIGWHVEVTVSFRPIGYIAPEQSTGVGRRRRYVQTRRPEEVLEHARAWVERKWQSKEKNDLRCQLWPGAQWTSHLVHGDVKYQEELSAISAQGVECHSFHTVLSELSKRKKGEYTGSAGSDLADIVAYYHLQGAKFAGRIA